MGKNFAGNIVNIVMLLMGIALLVSAQGIKTGAAMAQGGDFMPKLLTGFWVVLSAFILIDGLKKKGASDGGSDVKNFLATLALLLVYFLVIYPIGFVAASIIYIFIQTLLFAPGDAKTKKHCIIYAVIAIAVPITVNLIFVNVFSLILPEGMIF